MEEWLPDYHIQIWKFFGKRGTLRFGNLSWQQDSAKFIKEKIKEQLADMCSHRFDNSSSPVWLEEVKWESCN